jgi:hypothetical protein
MATIEEGLRSQLRNIEATYGRSVEAWLDLIRASGVSGHGEIVAMLKARYGLRHAAAHRLALISKTASNPVAVDDDPVETLYRGRITGLRSLHDQLMNVIISLGDDVEVAPKKGYLSLRRRKQFAMVKPAANHLDVGLVLPDHPVTVRFESASTFNALFSHRVRVCSEADIDGEMTDWLRRAFERAG